MYPTGAVNIAHDKAQYNKKYKYNNSNETFKCQNAREIVELVSTFLIIAVFIVVFKALLEILVCEYLKNDHNENDSTTGETTALGREFIFFVIHINYCNLVFA